MTDAQQLPLELTTAPYRNHYLFSDHYLDHLLPQDPRWGDIAAAAAELYPWLQALYRREAPHLPHYNESQLEEHWLKPLLRKLGHCFEPQATIPGLAHHINKPDYVLFPDEPARQAALAAQKSAQYAAHALAVLEVKAWEVPLSKKLPGGSPTFAAQNPSWQIDTYLRATGLAWGLLSNGRLWRLVHHQTSHKLDVYYEVDLLDLLRRDDPGALRYFLLFFRQAALLPDARGRRFLDDALRASQAYAVALEEDLRENAYRALEHLMQGFLDLPANGLGEPDLRAIYQNSLYLLYRLLFILYGESRGLLPLPNPIYREQYSLMHIKNDIAALRHPPARHSTLFWSRLQNLFQIINGDNPALNQELGVPRYNGGLFSPPLHPFLHRHQIGDQALVKAMDLLCRRETAPGQFEFADYRTLGVRHLGSIYEGLLEYQPRLADQPLVAVRDAQGERWLPALGLPAGAKVLERRETGQVYLTTDRGERKTTGSYYTPQPIVEYIVEQAIEPLIQAAIARVKARAASLTTAPARRQAGQALAAEILSLKICDPSMGSGHFLVETTDALSRALATDPYVEAAGTGEEDLVYWRRQVVERCIYGVDRNPLAVELAKLSLWLATVAADKPLSFLDHHLRCGDSLVGAWVQDLGDVPALLLSKKARQEREKLAAMGGRQANLFEIRLSEKLPLVIDGILQITGRESDTYETVQAKEAADQAVQALKAPFAAVAALWLSAGFGHSYTSAAYHEALEAIEQPERLLAQPAVQTALQQAAEQQFFHWELAFPEVFYDRQGQPLAERAGFDAIIGNPPYVRQEELGPLKPYFAQAHAAVYAGTADLFVYFLGQGVRLLRAGGRLAYISSNSWLRAAYATPLRAFLRTRVTMETVLDLGDNRVFADAPDVYPAIEILRRESPPADHAAAVAVFTRGEGVADLARQVAAKTFTVALHDQPDTGWQLEDDRARRLFTHLLAGGKPLEEVVDGQLYRGILTGLNEAFIVDQATRDRLIQVNPANLALLRPLVNGEDVRSWYIEDEKRWLILLPDGWTQQTFGAGLTEPVAWDLLVAKHPTLARHLHPFAEAARRRADQGAYWWELRPCSYYAAFDGPKIFWPEMAKQPRFAAAGPGIVGNKTTFMIPGEWPYLLGLLMSRALWFTITHLCVPIGERRGLLRYTLSAQFMARLPIPDAPEPVRATLSDLAQQLTAAASARYTLHTRVRRRILHDLGVPGGTLNQALTAWWTLDFAAFRAALGKAFRRDIPLKARDEWEEWLTLQRTAHEQATAAIVNLETALNTQIYALFELSPADIQIIEESTKYAYGEV